jgi:hypothetical protein
MLDGTPDNPSVKSVPAIALEATANAAKSKNEISLFLKIGPPSPKSNVRDRFGAFGNCNQRLSREIHMLSA